MPLDTTVARSQTGTVARVLGTVAVAGTLWYGAHLTNNPTIDSDGNRVSRAEVTLTAEQEQRSDVRFYTGLGLMGVAAATTAGLYLTRKR